MVQKIIHHHSSREKEKVYFVVDQHVRLLSAKIWRPIPINVFVEGKKAIKLVRREKDKFDILYWVSVVSKSLATQDIPNNLYFATKIYDICRSKKIDAETQLPRWLSDPIFIEFVYLMKTRQLLLISE